MINICLFGCGRMGQDHAAHIHKNPHANLYCVVDPITQAAQSMASKYGSKVYASADEALEDPKIDAVVIVSKTSTHTELICKSAKKGKPIFCEKPIDLSLNKVDECLKVVEECAVPLFIGFNRRFDPSFSMLQQKIKEGIIGPLEMLLISSRDNPMPSIEYLKTSGGMFCDMTIHDFDMARWLLQEEPAEVYATGSCMVDKRLLEFNDVDTSMVTLKTKSGAICHINNSRRSVYGYDQRIEAFGAKGMLRANNLLPTTLEIASVDGVKTDNPHTSFPQRYREAYRLEIEHFIEDVVMNGQPPLVSGFDGRQAMVIAEAANRSLREGMPVSIPASQEGILTLAR